MTGPATRAMDTEALDVTLRGFVGYAMKRAFLGIQSDLNRVLAPLNLRMMTFSALVVIADNPGLRPAHLAEALAVERPNLATLLAELEKDGLITRNPARDDGRALALHPTEAGCALCARAVTAVRAHEARITAALEQTERETLVRALQRLETAASEETRHG